MKFDLKRRKSLEAQASTVTSDNQQEFPQPTPAPPDVAQQPPVLIRLPEVRRRTGLSRSSIFRHVKNGTFPRPLRLTQHAIAWDELELSAWIRSRQRV